MCVIGIDLSPIPSVGLYVRRSVRRVYCGKMADWIRMPFGMVSGSVRDGCIGWVVIIEGEITVLG